LSRVLVTGGSGYLGTKIGARFLENGHSVVSIDVREPVERKSGIVYESIDVNTPRLLDFFASNYFDVVIHCAALVPLTRAYSDFSSVNIDGARNVASAAAKAGVKLFVHISSSAVYGKIPSGSAITTKTAKIPVEPYGVSKLGGEVAVTKELLTSETKLAIVRPRTIIGPDRGGIFDLFFSWIRDSLPIYTIGSGKNLFQFVHVDDLINAIEAIVKSGKEGEYNVGTDRFGSLATLFQDLINSAGSSSKVLRLNQRVSIAALYVMEKLRLSPLAPWHYRTFHYDFYFDTQNVRELGWRAKYSNNDMFLEAYTSYINHSLVHKATSESSPHSKPLASTFLSLIQKALKIFL
jgi:nucleoside-diphosphate-sugar epimerase